MSKKVFFLWALGCLILSGCVSKHEPSLESSKPALYAYIIGDVNSKYIDKESHADVYATPASCQKAVMGLLALKTLGPEFRYETKLYVTHKENQIQDAVIVFSGDPTLTTENLVTLLGPLKGKKIKGKMLLEASAFKVPVYSPHLMIEDIGTAYQPPVSSMNIDQNRIIVTLNPPINNAGYAIKSDVQLTSEPSFVRLFWEGSLIHAKGHINPVDEFLEFSLSPEDADQYVLNKIKEVMKGLEIQASIEIVRDSEKIPSGLIFINGVHSETLREFMPIAMKKSDNIVFDSLYLTMIARRIPQGITEWREGDPIIKGLILENFSIDMEGALFVDGSGVARYNRIQPRKLMDILKQGYVDQDFITSLPSPGEKNSTLESRKLLSKDIRAKTGNMASITCLCGYSFNQNKPKVFVMMVSSFAPPIQDVFFVIDPFLMDSLNLF
jgi:serine-type D-Ala-D-Ala carboxypeptidase/endopeptidase (penicillin-binding protein 4)